MIQLKRLVEGISELEIKGSKDLSISGIYSNSKLVSPKSLFVVKKGTQFDGSQFIADAIAAGAVAILTDIYDPYLKVTQLIHPNVSQIEGVLASKYFSYPSSKLQVIGITGTNGKTTTSYLIKQILDYVNRDAGLIGTVECIVGKYLFSSERTTPDVITNHKLMKEMVESGCKSCVIEVTSHGLSQNRTSGIDFSIAVFTNFSQDHLDYHNTLEEYLAAKQILFSKLKEGASAIVNSDDPASKEILQNSKAAVFTYGIEKGADLNAQHIVLTSKAVEFLAVTKSEQKKCRSPLIGKFNVYNLLAAISTGLCLGISLEDCIGALKNFRLCCGRLEKVKNQLDIDIFIDYAHSEDALRNVLETLRPLSKQKLLTVFGCGGDRDSDKREKMGKVVSEFSDIAIITSDNPRSENPEAIACQILKGCSRNCSVIVDLDRKSAIAKAIDLASPGDVLLIAGKGHEKEQVFDHYAIAFDDVMVARDLCKEKEKAPCA